MTLPRLNRQLVLEDPQKVFDGAGGFTVNWVALGTHWAQAKPRTGREAQQGHAPISVVPYTITVRAAPIDSPARPKPHQRFRDGARVYTIRAVTEDVKNDLYLICHADEETVA